MCTYYICVRTIYVYVLLVCTMICSSVVTYCTAGPLTAATTNYRATRGWTTDSDDVFKAAAAQPSQVLAINIEQMTLSELIQLSRWWRCQNSSRADDDDDDAVRTHPEQMMMMTTLSALIQLSRWWWWWRCQNSSSWADDDDDDAVRTHPVEQMMTMMMSELIQLMMMTLSELMKSKILQ